MGLVFNTQPYSIHDGPGIRTTVFLKVCRCVDHGVRLSSPRPSRSEVFFAEEKCNDCATDLSDAPTGVIEVHDGRSCTNRDECAGAGLCRGRRLLP